MESCPASILSKADAAGLHAQRLAFALDLKIEFH